MRKDQVLLLAALCSLGLTALPAMAQNAGATGAGGAGGATGANGARATGAGGGGGYGGTVGGGMNGGGVNGGVGVNGGGGVNGNRNGGYANGGGGNGNGNGGYANGGGVNGNANGNGNGGYANGGGVNGNGNGAYGRANGGVRNRGLAEEANAGAGTTGAPSATVPQYTIADAYIFAGSALHTAKVMTNEGQINVEAPQLLRQQARYLVRCIHRASEDIAAIDGNAVRTNPKAVLPVRMTQGQLQAAVGDATQFSQALSAGGIGPTYQITLHGMIAHLQNAAKSLGKVASTYPGTPNLRSASAAGMNANTAKIR